MIKKKERNMITFIGFSVLYESSDRKMLKIDLFCFQAIVKNCLSNKEVPIFSIYNLSQDSFLSRDIIFCFFSKCMPIEHLADDHDIEAA